MDAWVPPVANETEGLLGFLDQQRSALCVTAYGLTDEQARATPSISALSIGGLIKHAAITEAHWIQQVVRRQQVEPDVAEYADGFVLGPDEKLAAVMERLEVVGRQTTATVTEMGDLALPVPVPRDAPWYPRDVETWSLRWVLLHLIEETARHAGHADIIRESLDGATQYPLLAASQGWPATAWLTPWSSADAMQPASETVDVR